MRIGINHTLKCINVFCGNCVDMGDDSISVYSGAKGRVKPIWKLICDPSGDFILGRLFDYIDIKMGLNNVWTPGTRFKNTKTDKVIELCEIKRPVRGLHSDCKGLYIKHVKV